MANPLYGNANATSGYMDVTQAHQGQQDHHHHHHHHQQQQQQATAGYMDVQPQQPAAAQEDFGGFENENEDEDV